MREAFQGACVAEPNALGQVALPHPEVRQRVRPPPHRRADRIVELAGDDATRARMGTTARSYMEALASTEATAHGYARAITDTVRVVADPIGDNMRRWADALADLGVTEAELADGYGLRFARALESFTHPS